MPRPYHSPSSIALAERCERAWYHAYVDGIRSPGSAATELGGLVHKVLEAYYRGLKGTRAPNWASRAGQIATSALHLLPDPRSVKAYPEEAIGGPWCGDDRVLLRPDGDVTTFGPDGCRDDAKPGRAIVIDGCRYAGFHDLVVSGDDHDWREIGADHALCNEFLLVDYKSSSNIHKYGKPSAVLVDDFAANLYAYDVALQWDLDCVPCRWPYISTGSKREAVPSDFTIYADRAFEIIRSKSEIVRRVDAFECPEDAVCNPAACADYGGCAYHASKGGPCEARRKVSAFILMRSKGTKDNMALTPEQQAKFAALTAKRKGEAPPAAAPTEIPPPPAEEDTPQVDETGEVLPSVAPPAKDTLPPTPVAAPRKPRAVTAPKAAPVPVSTQSGITPAEIAVLAAEVASAHAVVEEILSRASGLAEAEAIRDAAIEALRKALS